MSLTKTSVYLQDVLLRRLMHIALSRFAGIVGYNPFVYSRACRLAGMRWRRGTSGRIKIVFLSASLETSVGPLTTHARMSGKTNLGFKSMAACRRWSPQTSVGDS